MLVVSNVITFEALVIFNYYDFDSKQYTDEKNISPYWCSFFSGMY